jgi:hypothetical protein
MIYHIKEMSESSRKMGVHSRSVHFKMYAGLQLMVAQHSILFGSCDRSFFQTILSKKEVGCYGTKSCR